MSGRSWHAPRGGWQLTASRNDQTEPPRDEMPSRRREPGSGRYFRGLERHGGRLIDALPEDCGSRSRSRLWTR